MRTRDIRRRETPDLVEEITRLRDEMFQQRFHGQSEDKGDRGLTRKNRRDIARIRTILRERELGIGSGAQSQAPEGN